MRQTKVTAMVEAGVMSAIAVVFALIINYVPILGGLLNMVWAVPVILVGVRHGLKWSIMTSCVSGILILGLTNPLLAAGTVGLFGLLGIMIGHALKSGYTPAKEMLWGMTGMIVSMVVIIGLSVLIFGVDQIRTQLDMMESAFREGFALYQNMGENAIEMVKSSYPEATAAPIEHLIQDNLAQMKGMEDGLIKVSKMILPASMVLAAGCYTYMNLLVSRVVLRRLGYSILKFSAVKDWTFPEVVLYLYVLADGLIVLGNYEHLEVVTAVGLNLNVLFSIPLLLQGLAVFYFLADKYNLSRMVRGIILLMVFTNGIFTYLTIFAGAFDIAMDYRKLRAPRLS